MAKILVVEDDGDLAANIRDSLKSDRHTVDLTDDGKDALHLLRSFNYDVVVLDWGLPGMDGITLCKELRSRSESTPILMLTGRTKLEEKEAGLDAGADDYLTKPFEMRELQARVRALLRRPAGVIPGTVKIGDVELNVSTHKVLKAGKEIDLPPIEFALLEFLMRHPNQIFSSDALLDRVWSSSVDASSDVVRKTVNKLRGKLDEDGKRSLIRTIHGVGYGLETPS